MRRRNRFSGPAAGAPPELEQGSRRLEAPELEHEHGRPARASSRAVLQPAPAELERGASSTCARRLELAGSDGAPELERGAGAGRPPGIVAGSIEQVFVEHTFGANTCSCEHTFVERTFGGVGRPAYPH